jgi:hypothetical protein
MKFLTGGRDVRPSITELRIIVTNESVIIKFREKCTMLYGWPNIQSVSVVSK